MDGTTKPFLRPIEMPKDEVPMFVDFVRGMLEIDPESRKSASELLHMSRLILETDERRLAAKTRGNTALKCTE